MSHSPAPRPIRLVIADRRRPRRALRALLGTDAGLDVVGEAADGDETLAQVERLRPGLVLIDAEMPRLDGVAAAARIKSRWPSIRVVVLGLSESCRAGALAAGADAFVSKGALIDELLRAVHGDPAAREAAGEPADDLHSEHGTSIGGYAAAGIAARAGCRSSSRRAPGRGP